MVWVGVYVKSNAAGRWQKGRCEMGRKKKVAVNTEVKEVKTVKKVKPESGSYGVVVKSAVIQTAKVMIDGLGDGQLTLKGLYYTEGDGHPEVYVLEFFIDAKKYATALRCFDRFMDAWRSYRRFVCLSKEVCRKGGRK
jgi:hypothetical protein